MDLEEQLQAVEQREATRASRSPLPLHGWQSGALFPNSKLRPMAQSHSRYSKGWRELLRRAWSETIPADYCWTRPNRRHVWTGLYLPGVVCEGVGEICIAVDCSGSINDRLLGLFEEEVRSILAGQQRRLVHVLYFDTEVHKVETYQAGQPIKLSPVGGGGTDFRPCFTWLNDRGIQPQTLVFLTDLWGTFPDQAPPYPVLWASTDTRKAPFGQVIPMEAA